MRKHSQEVIPMSTEIPTMEVPAASMNEPSMTQNALETTVDTQLLPPEPVMESGLRRYFCSCCYFCGVF